MLFYHLKNKYFNLGASYEKISYFCMKFFTLIF